MLILREYEISESREIIKQVKTHYSICVLLNFQASFFKYFERMQNFYDNYGFFPQYFLILETRKNDEEKKGVIFNTHDKTPALEFAGNLSNYLQGDFLGVKKYLLSEFVPADTQMLEAWGFKPLTEEDVEAKMSMFF